MLLTSRSIGLCNLLMLQKLIVSIPSDLHLPLLAPNIFFCSQIIKELCSSSSYSFHFVICPSMTSCRRQFLLRIWQFQLTFLRRILFRSVLFTSIRWRTYSLVHFTDHFTFSILLQHHFSKLFKRLAMNIQFSDLGVTCSPRDPRFTGLNPAEVDGFFRT